MARIWTAVLLTVGALLVAASESRASSVTNGGFEANVLATDTFCITYAAPLCPQVTGWTANFFVVNGAPSEIASPQPLPDGVQFAMVQGTNAMNQSVTIDLAGTYRLTWSDAGRGSLLGNETYDVLFDGNVLGSFSVITNSPWAFHSVDFTANAGVFTLRVAGTNPFASGSMSVLLDAFALDPVPEPGTVELEGMALACVAWRRARARRTAPARPATSRWR